MRRSSMWRSLVGFLMSWCRLEVVIRYFMWFPNSPVICSEVQLVQRALKSPNILTEEICEMEQAASLEYWKSDRNIATSAADWPGVDQHVIKCLKLPMVSSTQIICKSNLLVLEMLCVDSNYFHLLPSTLSFTCTTCRFSWNQLCLYDAHKRRCSRPLKGDL